MDSILVIAGIVFRENLRKKIILVFFILVLMILGWACMFQPFSLHGQEGVQTKFLKDIALFSISLMGMLITLVTTAGQLSGELENRTIYPLLAKPVRRWQVLVGKFVGALYIIYMNLALLGVIFLVLLFRLEHEFDKPIAEAVFFIMIECGVLASLCLFFSTLFTTAANVSATFFLYFLGHVKFAYGDYTAGQFHSPIVNGLVKLLQNPVFPPNLDYFNLTESIISGVNIAPSHLFFLTIYGIGLMFFYLLAANLVFLKKDL